ncbi:hypothetical protein HII28_17340 [Planctomonas sp. JC2975]|uniref:hypothetical protein n=1 Tax=Planctomonas sp. JC2975 TaxID=2729626 RepID=UPI0014732D2B|nr:hypothetical protein [Planctomonas sp. JC2975]NNC13633.1 hypothetical protein [Planctomonas sp. JC2975]
MRKLFVGAVAAIVLVLGGWLAVVLIAGTVPSVAEAQTCPAATPATVGTIVVPRGPVAGFCQPQLIMAAHIMNAGRDQGLETRTQEIGVMTAIGETGLRNLDYGDAAGADSRGLFQQRDNGAWGTLADRMDPYTAASNFFKKLITVDGWRTMDPSDLAHAVQVNADSGYYSQFWTRAQTIVTALDG